MSRSSARRGQVEPLAALVAVVAVVAGVSLYAGALADAHPDRPSSAPTVETAADRAVEAIAPAGVARPRRMSELPSVAPEGYRLNATLAAGDARWTVGPPVTKRTASGTIRPTSVRLAPGRIRPGRLRVVIWT